MKVHKGKYGQIHLIASLTAGLSRYHDQFAVSVVDEVISFIPKIFLLDFIFHGRYDLTRNGCPLQCSSISIRFVNLQRLKVWEVGLGEGKGYPLATAQITDKKITN